MTDRPRNDRNVDALADIISQTGLAPQHDSWARAMAKSLARRGVLVPCAIQQGELGGPPSQDERMMMEVYGNNVPNLWRLARVLERIARGGEEG